MTRRDPVTFRETLAVIGAVVTIDVIILMSWTVSDPLHWERTIVRSDKYGEPLESQGYCTSHCWRAFFGAIASFHLVLLFLACYLCYKARNIPTTFSEGKYIAFAMASNFQICLVAFPLLIIVTGPVESFFIRVVAIGINDLAIVVILFGNLMYSAFYGTRSTDVSDEIIRSQIGLAVAKFAPNTDVAILGNSKAIEDGFAESKASAKPSYPLDEGAEQTESNTDSQRLFCKKRNNPPHEECLSSVTLRSAMKSETVDPFVSSSESLEASERVEAISSRPHEGSVQGAPRQPIRLESVAEPTQPSGAQGPPQKPCRLQSTAEASLDDSDSSVDIRNSASVQSSTSLATEPDAALASSDAESCDVVIHGHPANALRVQSTGEAPEGEQDPHNMPVGGSAESSHASMTPPATSKSTPGHSPPGFSEDPASKPRWFESIPGLSSRVTLGKGPPSHPLRTESDADPESQRGPPERHRVEARPGHEFKLFRIEPQQGPPKQPNRIESNFSVSMASECSA